MIFGTCADDGLRHHDEGTLSGSSRKAAMSDQLGRPVGAPDWSRAPAEALVNLQTLTTGLTELAVALVMRMCTPFFRGRPGRWLWTSTLIVAVLTIVVL